MIDRQQHIARAFDRDLEAMKAAGGGNDAKGGK